MSWQADRAEMYTVGDEENTGLAGQSARPGGGGTHRGQRDCYQ